MSVSYYKRYRMEVSLHDRRVTPPPVPEGYELIAWTPSLLHVHADTKYRCFRDELDAQVFPCLGDPIGCLRLMEDIASRRGFLPAATWLIAHRDVWSGGLDYCGTVQGVAEDADEGGIQNLGITPEHRGLGLGGVLLCQTLAGFRSGGLRRVHLEVTAQNRRAISLYRRFGFRRVQTVYKAVEVAYS